MFKVKAADSTGAAFYFLLQPDLIKKLWMEKHEKASRYSIITKSKARHQQTLFLKIYI